MCETCFKKDNQSKLCPRCREFGRVARGPRIGSRGGGLDLPRIFALISLVRLDCKREKTSSKTDIYLCKKNDAKHSLNLPLGLGCK